MSMYIYKNKNLDYLSTFGLRAKSYYLLNFDNLKDISDVSTFVSHSNLPTLLLGYGSNMIFCSDFPGTLIQYNCKDITLLDHNRISVASGAKLDDLVKCSIVNKLYGLEALSGIPGTVGGAIALNAGAYGSTTKDCLEYARVYDITTKSTVTMSPKQIHYWHRSSIFRERRGENLIILDAVFRLKSKPVTYNHVKIDPNMNGQILRDHVLNLRKHLPDPHVIHNSGSFFLNPTLPNSNAHKLQEIFPEIAMRKYDARHYQISAGWLMEEAGFRGQNIFGFQISDNHANIVLNTNLSATGQQLVEFIRLVQDEIFRLFKINLVPEPILVGEEYLQGRLRIPSLYNSAKIH